MINLDCIEAINIGTNKRHSRNRVTVALNILFLHLQFVKVKTAKNERRGEMENDRDFLITMIFFHTRKLQFGANIYFIISELIDRNGLLIELRY